MTSETQIAELVVDRRPKSLSLMVMTCGCSRWLFVMVMTSMVVAAACGGVMKGNEKRELWVKENKNEEGAETEKNRLERETLLDGTSHMGGLHDVNNFTELPLSYVT